jgi:LacI family transcriptional regulator
MASIKEIAQLAGMSPSTVSRVLNNRTYVNPAIRERILALVQETGYVPNHAARSMVLNRSFTVGVIVPEAFSLTQLELFSALEREVAALGLLTHLFFVRPEAEGELRCLRRLKSEKLDGIFVLMELTDDALLDALQGLGIPVLWGALTRPGAPFPTFSVDDEAVGFDAARYLGGLGHERLGVVHAGAAAFNRLRVSGFRRAREGAGQAWDEGAAQDAAGFTPECGRRAALSLFGRRPELTAVFAATDELAIGVVRGLFELGRKVPDQVSVLGCGDVALGRSLTPGLTTLRQPVADIAARMVGTLQSQLGGESPDELRFVFAHRLVERESCRRLGS